MNLIYILMAFIITYPVLGKEFYNKKNISGISLSVVIGIISYFLGKTFSIIGGPVFGIIIGLSVAFYKRKDHFNPGIKITGKKLLQAAIILLGFEMNLINVLEVGSQSLVIMLVTLVSCFVTAYITNKWLKIPSNTAILVAVGTCICGGSAIAATSPVLKAEEDEVVTAISTIFLFNIIAAIIFPPIGRALGMSDIGFGIWAGTAINDTSSVVAASYTFSNEAGNLATIVKLTRSLLIIPITFVLAIYKSKDTKSSEANFSIAKVFPWFILGFVATCIINTIGIFSVEVSEFMGSCSKFLIVVAMSAIGLNTNLLDLISKGKKPIILGSICWFVICIVSLIVQNIIGLV